MTSDLIFDLGMNNGDDTDFYLAKGFRVVAVEANPDLCAAAMQRFSREISSGRLRIVNKAISESEDEIELFINEDVTGWSTIRPEWVKTRRQAGTRSRSVSVPATTFHRVLREFGVPYYLKADIQGAELLCLEALLHFEDRPKFISISAGTDALATGAMRHTRRGLELFSQLGYRDFKIVPQRGMEHQKCPFPAREGRYIDYGFCHGSSGPFGEELPGEWVDAERALREHRKIVMSYRLAGNSRSSAGWFKKLPSGTIRRCLDRLFWRGTDWYDTHARLGR